MKYRFKFLVFVVLAGIVSTSMHELGHCIFYWIQGIPASMSLVMEYPLIDISAKQYGIGSLGGPIVNIFLILGAYYFIRTCDKRSRRWTVYSAVIVANSFYLIFRSLLGLVKNDGGEIESVMQLVGMHFQVAAVLFLIMAIAMMTLWIRKYQIRISIGNIGFYVLLFFSFITAIMVMELIDERYFRDKYPTIEIENVERIIPMRNH